MVQYYLYNDPIQKGLIVAWLTVLTNHSARLKESLRMDEAIVKLYTLTENYAQLEKSLEKFIQKYEADIE
jgi:hypothetical protein